MTSKVHPAADRKCRPPLPTSWFRNEASGLRVRRRFADLYPGEAQTDARDAFIITDAARAMPHSLRSIDGADEAIAEPEMIVGFDDDLAGEATRIANRLHGLLTQIHPSPERVPGPRLQHPAVLTLLERFGSPAQIRKAGRRRLVTLLRPKAPRMTERLFEDIFTALDEQTVTVPGTEAAALMVPSLAGSLTAVLDQRKLLAGRIEDRVPGGLRPTTTHQLDQGDRARPRAGSCRGEAVGAPLTACRTVSSTVDDACVRRGPLSGTRPGPPDDWRYGSAAEEHRGAWTVTFVPFVRPRPPCGRPGQGAVHPTRLRRSETPEGGRAPSRAGRDRL
ncbi:Transposase [Streptomyces sp. OK228]|nr:Transposase [Streptomyces sp. OK228]